MSSPDTFPLHSIVVLIDLVGALLMMPYIVFALTIVLRTGAIGRARILVAEGAILTLSFKTAGTLMKTLELHTWNQILTFGAILALRVILKQLFVWEKSRVIASSV